jgi:hypothetical protein
MIRPRIPCKPGCPGWRVARVLAITVVRPCSDCWAREILKPSPRYYHRQPECLAALARQERARVNGP